MNSEQSISKSLPRREFIRQVGATAASAALFAQSISAFGQENSKTITLALVGAAHIHTPNYVNILKKRPEVKVKYVWDHDQERAARNAKELGSQVVDDPKTVWNDPEIVGVVICSETNRHRDLVVAAANAKKHMFVEKPLGITAKDSKAMADAIEKANLIFTTGYFMRTAPAHIFLKEQIEKGSFGKITRARGSNCHNGSLGGWFDKEWRWMADPKQAGVGAFGDLGTHSLDILMWLLGDVESVTAAINVVTGRYENCDESGEALMKFAKGAAVTLAAGWVDVANPVTLEISGTEGHAVIINNKLYFNSKNVKGADGKEPWTELPSAPPAPMDQFVNALMGNKDMPLVKPREAAARVSVMEAAYKGAHNNAWVKVS
ncbi:Gfo/Idh/MocA family protein [Pedosphaera parvula]|uniref:Oxidoreductase domain protein n=1 Tax=Pedosphaera parvula (strain Ellin514) TaxID=320771 RepID=B9XPN3_PEDPL|nr:Gfo/Idh/MocA family oxidoreductase [Pedosphaera parvula]EEF58156.1 oxidoreductase domain protein [Pedosphaera parvula Ellin514]